MRWRGVLGGRSCLVEMRRELCILTSKRGLLDLRTSAKDTYVCVIGTSFEVEAAFILF